MKRAGVALLGLLVLILITGAAFANPQGPLPGQARLQKEYEHIQPDPTIPDDAKVRNAVDTYFSLYYSGLRDLETQNFAFLFEGQSAGQDGRAYQTSRQRFFVTSYKYYHVSIQKYTYEPAYLRVQISGDTASVTMRPLVEVFYSQAPGDSEFLGETEHTVTLARRDSRWIILRQEKRSRSLSCLILPTAKPAHPAWAWLLGSVFANESAPSLVDGNGYGGYG